MNTNNNTLEDLQKSLTDKLGRSQLFQETLLECTKYPCGVLIRNGNKKTRMSRGQYGDFLDKAKEVLDRKHFPHLFRKNGSPKYRTHGGGFLIPVEKSLNVETIIHSLCQIAQKFNLGLKIEKAKDGPCEDGRNIITEWKFLPPDVTIENAEKLFEDFGIISSTKESEEGLFITFSIIFDTLPLCSMMNPHNNNGSKWFYVFGNRPTLCRFVSSLSCSNCHVQGHHHSKCPAGLPEVAKQYRKLILGNKASAASSNNSQNQNGTISLSHPAKKSAKHRSSSGGTKDKDSNPPDDISSDGMKKQKQKKENAEFKYGPGRRTDNWSRGETIGPVGRILTSVFFW